jgi:hypothetical protein
MPSAISFKQYVQSVLRVPVSFIRCALTQLQLNARLQLGPVKLWRHVNDYINMEIWVPLLWKTTQVQFVAESDCGDFAGRENITYVCPCIYVAVSCGTVFFFNFGTWLCFLIDLPQFFVFKMRCVRPEGSHYCTYYITQCSTQLVQLHRNYWRNNWSVDATCCCDLHLW